MTGYFWLGMAIAFMSGVFNGCFAIPMKYSTRWKWGNTWGLFILIGTVFVPIILASLFVPGLRQIYHEVSWQAILLPCVFGFLWGTAMVTFGLSINAVGVAVAFAVVAGINALIGSIVPLLIRHPEDLLLPAGILLMASLPILFAGLWLYARAGLKREKEQSAPGTTSSTHKGSFLAGLALCIYTGVLAPCFNLGFVYGNQVAAKSLEFGASNVTSTYAVLLLVLGAGFIPNALYCAHLIHRDHGWGLFVQAGAAKEILIAIAMAVLWCSASFGYGIGANMAGKYGTSIGYALWGATTVIASTVGGISTGEWKGTSGSTRRLLAAAMALVVLSLIVMNMGGLF